MGVKSFLLTMFCHLSIGFRNLLKVENFPFFFIHLYLILHALVIVVQQETSNFDNDADDEPQRKSSQDALGSILKPLRIVEF